MIDMGPPVPEECKSKKAQAYIKFRVNAAIEKVCKIAEQDEGGIYTLQHNIAAKARATKI